MVDHHIFFLFLRSSAGINQRQQDRRVSVDLRTGISVLPEHLCGDRTSDCPDIQLPVSLLCSHPSHMGEGIDPAAPDHRIENSQSQHGTNGHQMAGLCRLSVQIQSQTVQHPLRHHRCQQIPQILIKIPVLQIYFVPVCFSSVQGFSIAQYADLFCQFQSSLLPLSYRHRYRLSNSRNFLCRSNSRSKRLFPVARYSRRAFCSGREPPIRFSSAYFLVSS